MENLNEKYYEAAKQVIPDGLNSSFRSFSSVGNAAPIFMKRGKGAYIYSEDGNKYIDFSLGWGPLILGHSHKVLRKVLKDCSKNSCLLGTPTVYETELANLLTELFPSIEQVRLQTSGTEAVGLALRLARAHTKKDYIITVHGSYHGHQNDTLLTTVGNEVVASSLGIPKDVHKYNLRVHYNDHEALQNLLQSRKDIAAVLIEPVPGNMGLIAPVGQYLAKVKSLCVENGVLLIFDEVITGARISLHGAQGYFNVQPDITVLGKAIAGGLPIGAVGGRKEIMSLINAKGVYAAGTYAGNPLSVKAAIATLSYLRENDSITKMGKLGQVLVGEINGYAVTKKVPLRMQALGTIFGIYFGRHSTPVSFKDVEQLDEEAFSNYHQYMISKGIYLSPSAEDVGFLCTEHSLKHIKSFIKCSKEFIDQYGIASSGI